MSFLAELKRRNVIRVAAAYVFAGWLIIQVAETIFPLFGFDEVPARIVVILLAIGLPIILVFSWLYELTPDGLKLEREIDHSRSIGHHTGKQLDRMIIIALTLAIGYFAIDKFIFDPSRDRTLEHSVAERVRDELLIESYGDRSIAVMPFANMSDEASNEYFSDGISEEILNLLAGIPELRVISRSSTFALKGKDISIPTIADQLDVTHVLEGSVRKSGSKVRITAQLIEASTDTHVWSGAFDRELGDIFAVQYEIAEIVVGELRPTLLRDLPGIRPPDPEAYTFFLEARHALREGTIESVGLAERLLKQSLEIDPTYIHTWLELAAAYQEKMRMNQLSPEEGWDLVQMATEGALSIDADSPYAYAMLATLASERDGNVALAVRYIQRALETDPTNVDAMAGAAILLMALDRMDDAIRVQKYIVARDPVNPNAHSNIGIMLLENNKFSEAKSSFQLAWELSPNRIGNRYFIGLANLFMGDAEAALEMFEQETDDEWHLKGLALAYYSLGRLAKANSALDQLINDWGEQWPAEVAHVYSFRGDLDNAFRWLELDSGGNWANTKHDLLYRNLHPDPRWQEFLGRKGASDAQLAEIDFQTSLLANDVP